MKRVFALLVILTVLLLAGISCEENLPPYRDPAEVFQSNNAALYVIRPAENSLKVFVNIVNMFDDTFDGTALLQGTVTIEWSKNSSFRRTFNLGPGYIISARGYNSGLNKLTFNSGDTVRLGFSWNFVADDGRTIDDWVSHRPDPNCQQRFISDPLTFFVRSQVKVFEKTSLVVAPTLLYSFQHHRSYFSDQYCTPLPPNLRSLE